MTKKGRLKLKISLAIIINTILTLLILNVDNIMVNLTNNAFEESHYEKLNKESNLGSLEIEDFPKQKSLPKSGLAEITFSEFIEIIENEDEFKNFYTWHFSMDNVIDNVTYKEIKSTRFFKKEDLSGIYLTDNNKRLFSSYEIFYKNERKDLYEILKEDKIFFYEKVDDHHLEIKKLPEMIIFSYTKELYHESFINHHKSIRKYINGEIDKEEVPLIVPKDGYIRYSVSKEGEKIHKSYDSSVNPTLDMNKRYKDDLNDLNDLFVLQITENQKNYMMYVLAIWIISIISISGSIIGYLRDKNKEEIDEILKIKEKEKDNEKEE